MTALALSQVINIVDPHIIVVGGGISNIEYLYDGVERYWQQYVFSDQTQIPAFAKPFMAMPVESVALRGYGSHPIADWSRIAFQGDIIY
jgi:predicted NBD/HSP70 family sugar kinase